MKKTLRILAVLLAVTLFLTCFVGCGNKKKKIGNAATDIEIAYWNSGLGTAWLDAVIDAFCEEYPDYNVQYAEKDSTSVTATYGEKMKKDDTVDIYMGIKNYDISCMLPLDAILDATAPGDNKPLREKWNPNYLALETAADGKVYQLTYGGGVLGLVYNTKMFADAGITQLPRTTQELKTVCAELRKNKVSPICQFKGGGYWGFIGEAWFDQYEGQQAYNDFYNVATKELMLKEDGRYATLEAMEGIITKDNVAPGSNSDEFTQMQTKFILNNAAAMMVNGSWLSNEIQKNGDKSASTDGFAMMRLPVISSITDRLKTVRSDTVLRLVISALDDIQDGKAKETDYKSGSGYAVDGNQISAADWQAVKEARFTLPMNYAGETAFIPSYSSATEGAQKFLQFLYSDKGYKIYTDTLKIAMPLALSNGTIDISSWNSFEQSQYHLLQESISYATHYILGKNPIYIDGGAKTFYDKLGVLVPRFCSQNASDRLTAKTAWAEITQEVKDNYTDWQSNIKK